MKTKVAQIGVGYWGPNLLRNLMASPLCEVKAVADLSPQRRDFVQSTYPTVSTTAKIDDLFQDPEIAAVVVATPASTHFDLVTRALQAGKHVLVEKPMATTTDEVDGIDRLAKEVGRVAMVGHTFLFNAAVRYLKELIDTGELGDVRYIYSQRLNLGRIRSDVDALWNLAPHDVSIIQYLLGDPKPEDVQRQGMDFVQDGIDDVVFLNIRYPNRVMAHVHVSWLDPHKIRRMTVVGSKKMAVYDDVADDKIAIYDKGIDRKAVLGENMDFDRTAFADFNHRSGDILLPKINFTEPLKAELEHFFDCIEKGAPCLTGPAHARRVVEILSAGSAK
jgi:predicted dehydrogenase